MPKRKSRFDLQAASWRPGVTDSRLMVTRHIEGVESLDANHHPTQMHTESSANRATGRQQRQLVQGDAECRGLTDGTARRWISHDGPRCEESAREVEHGVVETQSAEWWRAHRRAREEAPTHREVAKTAGANAAEVHNDLDLAPSAYRCRLNGCWTSEFECRLGQKEGTTCGRRRKSAEILRSLADLMPSELERCVTSKEEEGGRPAVEALNTRQLPASLRREHTEPTNARPTPRREGARPRREHTEPTNEGITLRTGRAKPRGEHTDATNEGTTLRTERPTPRREHPEPTNEGTTLRTERPTPRREHTEPEAEHTDRLNERAERGLRRSSVEPRTRGNGTRSTDQARSTPGASRGNSVRSARRNDAAAARSAQGDSGQDRGRVTADPEADDSHHAVDRTCHWDTYQTATMRAASDGLRDSQQEDRAKADALRDSDRGGRAKADELRD
jgi:hypothetical protein